MNKRNNRNRNIWFKESINPLNETLTEMKILNDSLKECVTKIRSICYKTHDLINAEVINNLKNAQGISYFEDLKRDQIVLFSNYTIADQEFLPRGNKFCKDLVNISNKHLTFLLLLIFVPLLKYSRG